MSYSRRKFTIVLRNIVPKNKSTESGFGRTKIDCYLTTRTTYLAHVNVCLVDISVVRNVYGAPFLSIFCISPSPAADNNVEGSVIILFCFIGAPFTTAILCNLLLILNYYFLLVLFIKFVILFSIFTLANQNLSVARTLWLMLANSQEACREQPLKVVTSETIDTDAVDSRQHTLNCADHDNTTRSQMLDFFKKRHTTAIIQRTRLGV